MEYTPDFFRNGFEAFKKEADRLAGQPVPILQERPDPKTWSALECIEHLSRTGRQYYIRIERTLKQADPPMPSGPPVYRPRFWMRWFIGWTLPPYRTGYVKAPKMFRPDREAVKQPEATVERFKALQDDYLQLLTEYQDRRLDTANFSSPITFLLQMNPAEALAFVLAHQKRHFWQARRISNMVSESKKSQ